MTEETTIEEQRKLDECAKQALKTLTFAQPSPTLATIAVTVLFSAQAAWIAAVVCLALSAGETFGRPTGFLVAGALAALTSAVRGQRK